MKKQIMMLIALVLSLTATAQEQQVSAQTETTEASAFLFGYINFDEVLVLMPDYAIAKRNIEDLRIKYEAETRRSEEEFNRKYEDFLDGQRDFAPSILRKRQAEIQDMMDRNVAFKEEAGRLLAQAERDAIAPLREKLTAAIQSVGSRLGLAFVLNSAANSLPFVDPVKGVDITEEVKKALEITEP